MNHPGGVLEILVKRSDDRGRDICQGVPDDGDVDTGAAAHLVG